MKCSDIDISLPLKISKYFVIEIEDVSDFIEKKDDLYCLKLMPIRLNKDKIDIAIVDFLMKKSEGGEITLVNLGSETFTYSYNKKYSVYNLTNRLRSKM